MSIMDDKRIGIYIHIPFCLKKCPYCGFYSAPPAPNLPDCGEESIRDDFIYDNICIRKYKERIINEIKNFDSGGRTADSIFFGGGTPTLMPPIYIEEIINAIKEKFSVPYDCEITMEGNPGTFDKEKLTKYYEAGVNRLSIGIQSFDNEVLKTLGRIHDAAEAENAFSAARAAGFDNINLDLMFGIPGQTISKWTSTIQKAIKLNPEHISFYSLQLEEGTPYLESFERGEFDEIPDEVDRDMYHLAIRELKAAGYKHYEISNASKPGFECRHNLKYWTGQEYVGFGDSAASYIDGTRYTMMLGDKKDFHVNSEFDEMSEFMFTGLRLTAGVNYGMFKSRFGIDLEEAFKDRWNLLSEFFESGMLKRYVDMEGNPVSLVITEKGLDVSNKIMAIFV